MKIKLILLLMAFFIASCGNVQTNSKKDSDLLNNDGISVNDGLGSDSDNLQSSDSDKVVSNDNTAGDTDNNVANDNIQNDNEKPDYDGISQNCGNGTVEGSELCDGGVKNCIDIDASLYSAGKAKCADDCKSWDTSTCDGKNKCANGSKRCVDTTDYQTCGDYNSDGLTEWSSSIACGFDLTCTGSGDCVSSCTSHYTYECYSGDVYYYDSCSNIEEKKEDCGTSGYTGSPYCAGGHLYQDYITVGCSGNDCTASTAGTKIQDCGTAGCTGGSCNSCTTHYTYACYSGNVYWYDSCSNLEDIKQNCAGAGCSGSACSSTKASTWYDSTTGLTWQNSAISYYTQANADTACYNLSLASYTDWRLPSISELRSLVRGCTKITTSGTCNVSDSCSSYASCFVAESCGSCTTGYGPSDTGMYWDAALLDTGANYWSSTVLSDYASSYGWAVNFSTGTLSYLDNVSTTAYVRCVRGGSLSAPSSISASDGSYTSYVTISWGSVAGAEKYYVYRATSSGGTYSTITASGTTSTSYTDYPPAASTYYYYKVAAYSSSYGYSSYSAYDSGWCY